MDITLRVSGPPLRLNDREAVGLHQPSPTLDQESGIVTGMTTIDEKPWLSEPNLKNVETMDDYLLIKRTEAKLSLELAKIHYEAFRERLSKTHPELASKHFGFTVDASGNFTIVDPKNSLSQSEKAWLAKQLSEYRGLKENLMAHAEAATAVAKYDTTGILSRYQLANDEIGKLIDYGAVVKSDYMERAFEEQVQNGATCKIPFISENV